MLNKWIEKYIIKYIAALLNSGGQGWKTITGLLILIVDQAVKLCVGSGCEVIRHAYDILNQLPHVTIQDAGIVLLAAGLAGKLVNYIPRK